MSQIDGTGAPDTERFQAKTPADEIEDGVGVQLQLADITRACSRPNQHAGHADAQQAVIAKGGLLGGDGCYGWGYMIEKPTPFVVIDHQQRILPLW